MITINEFPGKAGEIEGNEWVVIVQFNDIDQLTLDELALMIGPGERDKIQAAGATLVKAAFPVRNTVMEAFSTVERWKGNEDDIIPYSIIVHRKP